MNIFERFEVIEDPRDVRGKKKKLIEIIIKTIYGIQNKGRRIQQYSVLFRIEQGVFREIAGNRVRKNTESRLPKRCICGNKPAEIHGSIHRMDERYSEDKKWRCN